VTTLLLAHPPQGGVDTDPTFTIADALLHMRSVRVRMREVRIFSVAKLRGVAHIGGWHTFRITGEGVEIHPRMESLIPREPTVFAGSAPADASDEMLDLAVEGLSGMLGGGLARDSVTLAVGTPGSGKTLLGVSFLTAGADAGERGLFFGYHETPEALIQKAEAIGLPLRRHLEAGNIQVCWKNPAELLADEEAARASAPATAHARARSGRIAGPFSLRGS
jgi:circadian clock protein KaiC